MVNPGDCKAGDALLYVGPKPEQDVPSWIRFGAVSFRRDAGDGLIEVFSLDGSRLVHQSDLALPSPVSRR